MTHQKDGESYTAHQAKNRVALFENVKKYPEYTPQGGRKRYLDNGLV